jgi:hypothetical protein
VVVMMGSSYLPCVGCSNSTPLQVVTDGILLREMQSDFLLTKYRHASLSRRA